MARTVSITDDLDGSHGAAERKFTIGEAHYVIDLTDTNYAKLLEAIEPWRSVARIERRGNLKLNSEERVRIREWAEKNGKPLKERGRFPHSVVQEYFEATMQDDLDLS